MTSNTITKCQRHCSGGACKSQETEFGIVERQILCTRYTLRHFQERKPKRHMSQWDGPMCSEYRHHSMFSSKHNGEGSIPVIWKCSSLHLRSRSTRTITNSHWKEIEWETQENLQQVLHHTPDRALRVVTTWRRPWSVSWLDTPQLIHVAHQLVRRHRFQTVETQQCKKFQFHGLTLTCFSYGSWSTCFLNWAEF